MGGLPAIALHGLVGLPAIAMFGNIHQVAGALLTALVLIHVLAALKHRLVDHAGVFKRTWRGQRKMSASSGPLGQAKQTSKNAQNLN